MNKETMHKIDFISSIVILLFSGAVIYFSLVMERYEDYGWYATPGLTPVVFSILLIGCGLIMLVRSLRAGGHKAKLNLSKEKIVQSTGVQHFVVVLGLVLLYYFLFGKVHFVLISSAYVFFNILYFRTVPWWKNLLISIITASVVWYLFNFLFLIPLP
jgi:hypothetical protein